MPNGGRADTDLTQSGQITINPSSSPVVLALQGPAFDSAATDGYGLTLSYHDSTSEDPTAVTLHRMFRPVGRYQWEFSTSTGDGRLAMQLGNDHALTLFSSANAQNTIVLRPGAAGTGGVWVNDQRLATTNEIAGSYLPMHPTQFALGTGATLNGSLTGIAAGTNARASGSNAVALGYMSQALCPYSLAAGNYALVDGAATSSVAIGRYAHVSGGANSFALGASSYVSGAYALAIGANCEADGIYSSALGQGRAYADNSLAMGWGSANGNSDIAIGGYSSGVSSASLASGTSTGDFSVAIGKGAWAFSPHQMAIGYYNLVPDNGWDLQSTSPIGNDFLFIIGNGADPEILVDGDGGSYEVDHRSNAFTVAWNGNTRMQGAVTVDGGPAAAPAKSIFKRDVDVQGVLRVRPAGDVSMGDFTTGSNPTPP